ncbi:MAG: CCA tRNA nucleotidyltransferase [Acidobacteria bacterium]|nr:CCA tRNA nucleotidyltransferase [Acidobacteriota bacterium]
MEVLSHQGQAGGSLAREAALTLRRAGHQVFLVGGCVRDRLLRLPIHDRDLATSATPPDLLQLFPDAVLVGAHFGVILLRRDGEEVQIATYRSEGGYRDGRHPEEVQFEKDVREDLRRRDFTINALLEDPVTGEITDLVGGRQDLHRRLIRAIGDPGARFAEDYLRLLRAVRFAARLGFHIEPHTMDAMRRHAAGVREISPERVRDEISRILTEGGARRGFELLDDSGLLPHVLPEVARMKGVEQPPDFHPEGDVWLHTLGLLERLDHPPLEIALAALLHDVGKPLTQTREDRIRFNGHDRVGAEAAREILARLRYPAEVIEAVSWMTAQHMRFKDAIQMTNSTFKRFARQPRFGQLLELHRLDLLAGQRPQTNYDAVRQRLDAIPPEALRPQPLVTGRDLIGMGFRPGPLFALVLHAVETEQLEGRLQSRESALEFARTEMARRASEPAST